MGDLLENINGNSDTHIVAKAMLKQCLHNQLSSFNATHIYADGSTWYLQVRSAVQFNQRKAKCVALRCCSTLGASTHPD